MDETIRQEILLQTNEEGFDATVRMQSLEQSVKFVTSMLGPRFHAPESIPSHLHIDAFQAHTLTLAKRFETYIKTGE